MWWTDLLFSICIIKVLSSLQSAFMKKIAGLCQNHEFGMVNSEVYSHLLSTIMMEAEIRMDSELTLIWMARLYKTW
jgi:hypothetical protein